MKTSWWGRMFEWVKVINNKQHIDSLCYKRSLFTVKHNLIAWHENGKLCEKSVVGFFSSLSFSWIPCLLQNFFLLYSSWIIKKCCDSQYDCESGAAVLKCAVTFACFSHSSQCSPCLFSCFRTWFTSQSMMLQSSCPKSHLEGARGGIVDDEYSKSRICPRLQSEYYSSESVFRSGCFSQGREKGGRDIFFPIMHQQQDPNWHRGLGSFSRDKHPVSRLSPSKGNLPGASIHHNTHARCLLKHNWRPKRPTHSSPHSWPAYTANDPTSSVFHAPADSHGCQAWCANESSLALQKPQWLPWEKVIKTAAGKWKIHGYHITI